jgi:hypothetical protein
MNVLNMRNVSTWRDQQGMSLFSMLLMLCIGGLIFLCVARMSPAYMDNQYAETALKALSNPEGPLNELTASQVRKQLSAFFIVNRVNSQIEKSLKLHEQQRKLLVTLDYEVRVPILYNVEVVMTFKNHWDSSRPDDCCKAEGEIESQ